MKRKLLKTFLLAAGLLVGGNAWADAEDVFTQNFTKDGDKTAVTDYGFVVVTENNSSPKIDFTDSDGKLVLVSGGNNGSDVSSSAKASFTAVEGDYNVNFSCTWSTGNATGTRGYSRLILANAAGNIALQLDYFGQDNKLQVNGSNVATSVDRQQTFAVTATLNLQTKQITALTIGNAYTQSGSIAFKDATATTISALQFTANTKASWNNTTSIDDIVITKEVITATYTTVTFKYEDMSGNSLSSLKADVEQDAEVGATVSGLIGSTLTAEFRNNDESVKYTYNTFSSTDETVQDGGSTVVTLKFNAIPKFTYTIKAVDSQSNDLGTIASVSGFEGETLSLYWSKYIKSGDKWYVTSTNSFYKSGITEAGSENVTYAESDIDYFIECENMNGVRHDNRFVADSKDDYSGYYKLRINNYYPTIYTDVFADGGVFNISIPYSNSNETVHTYQLRTRDGSGNLSETITTWTGPQGTGTFTYNGLVIPAGHSVAISCDDISGNSNARMDYLILTKVSSVSAPITSATGYATFSSTYALNFTGISKLTAYKATACNGTTVTLEPITGTVAPNTGLVIQGETTDIPVVATGDAQAENLLVACSSETPITPSATGTNYVLSVQSDVVVFAPVTGDNATVAAGHAFLYVQTATPSRTLNIVFADEATGISAVQNSKEQSDEVYNLAGQRVAQPTKGLYIVNGKKVIMK